VLGFAILSMQITSYPHHSNHPEWIMDEVVLPSLATLKFLICGKAYSIVRSIKKIAWNKPQELNSEWVYMSPTTYSMEESFQSIFHSFCYSSNFWETIKPNHPFGGKSCQQLDIMTILAHFIVSTTTDTALHHHELATKPMSDGLNLLYSYTKLCTESISYTNKQLTDFTIEIIQEVVVDQGRVPHLDWELNKTLIQTELKDTAILLFYESFCTTQFHKAAVASMMYRYRNNTLLGSENEISILSQIITLNLEISERECIIYLTHLISDFNHLCPVAIKVDKFTILQISSMTTLLQEVQDSKKDREWLWSQFPIQWREASHKNDNELTVKLATDIIIKNCEDRIVRIIE
jgi:hypothetical protein